MTIANDPLLRHLPRTDDGGVELGPVIIHDRLGKGGMGSVFLAHHKSLDIDVAVKIIPVEEDDKENAAALRFMREAQTAAKISHPNLVRVFALGEERGLKYIIQEYVKGAPGGEYMEQHGSLSETLALQIIAQIALALESAHEKGVVHRDVKPDNILITEEEEMTVKLSDLGLAKKVDMASSDEIELDFNITSANTAIGTPHFMAPEQVTDAKNVDHRADIYSLGVTLYQFLSLDLPFVSDNIYGLFHIILNGNPKPLRQVAPKLMESVYRLVDWMTQKDPNRRPQSAGDVFDAADAILACIENGTDDWYPPGEAPKVELPLTLQIPVEPPAPIDVPEPSRRPLPPSAPPMYRPPSALPQSDARKRLSQMRDYAESVASQGENPVEFFVPDALKQRERIERLRTGQRDAIQRRDSTGLRNEELKEKTRKITGLRKAITEPAEPVDLKKLQKQGSGPTPKLSGTKRTVVVEPLPKKRSWVAPVAFLSILTIAAVGFVFRDRWMSLLSLRPSPKTPPQVVPAVLPPNDKPAVVQLSTADVIKHQDDINRIMDLVNDRAQWQAVTISCDTIIEKLSQNVGDSKSDPIIRDAKSVKRVVELLNLAFNAPGNREASEYQLEAFKTAPDRLRKNLNFYLFFMSRTSEVKVDLLGALGRSETFFSIPSAGKVIRPYNPRTVRSVKFSLPLYEESVLSLQAAVVDNYEIALSTTFPDVIELGLEPSGKIKLNNNKALAAPVFDETNLSFYLVCENNKLLQIRSNLKDLEEWNLPLEKTIQSVIGQIRHPKTGIYVLSKYVSQCQLIYISVYNAKPLQWARDVNQEIVSGPFLNDAGSVLIAAKNGILTTNADGIETGFITVNGGICAATDRRDIALGLENGGVVIFDKINMIVKAQPVPSQDSTGSNAIAFLRYNENGERLIAVSRKGVIYDIRGGVTKTIRLPSPAAAPPSFGNNDSAFVALTNGDLYSITAETATWTLNFIKAADKTADQAPARLSTSGIFYKKIINKEHFYFPVFDRLMTYDSSGTLNLNNKMALNSMTVGTSLIVQFSEGQDQLIILTENNICSFNLPINP